MDGDLYTAGTAEAEVEVEVASSAPTDAGSIDLDAIERDLTDVQSALDRLNDGEYWTDEVTGEPIPDEVLATFPLTRTVSGKSSGVASGNAASDAASSL